MFGLFGRKKKPPTRLSNEFNISHQDVNVCYEDLRNTFISSGAISYDELRYDSGLIGKIKTAAKLQCQIDKSYWLLSQLESEVETLRVNIALVDVELETPRFWPIGHSKPEKKGMILGIISASFTGIGVGSILSGMIEFDPTGIVGWVIGIGLLVVAYAFTLSTINTLMIMSVVVERQNRSETNAEANYYRILADFFCLFLIIMAGILTFWSYSYIVIDPVFGGFSGYVSTCISVLMTMTAVVLTRCNMVFNAPALQAYADEAYTNGGEIVTHQALKTLIRLRFTQPKELKQKEKELKHLGEFNYYLGRCFDSLCQRIEQGQHGEHNDEVDPTRTR